MGIEERREREKHELKRRIVKVARQLAVEEGWQKVTIRRIADLIEYSPPTIYEFFDNKEALLDELAREGFRLLLADLQRANLEEGEPQTLLLNLARVYWDFAWEHPELYQVIYGMKATFHTRTDLTEAHAVFSLIRRVVHETLKPGDWEGRHHRDLLNILWGLWHGLISLAMEEKLGGGPPHGKELMEQATADLLSVWCR